MNIGYACLCIIIVGYENSHCVPSVTALVLSHWSQTGNLDKQLTLKQHNLFTYSGEESSSYRMLPCLKENILQSLTCDGETIVDATNTCKYIILHAI